MVYFALTSNIFFICLVFQLPGQQLLVPALVGQVPGPERLHLGLRQNLPPIFPAALLLAVPTAQVKEIYPSHVQHILWNLSLFRIMDPVEACG